jgi:hypothetical protein
MSMLSLPRAPACIRPGKQTGPGTGSSQGNQVLRGRPPPKLNNTL